MVESHSEIKSEAFNSSGRSQSESASSSSVPTSISISSTMTSLTTSVRTRTLSTEEGEEGSVVTTNVDYRSPPNSLFDLSNTALVIQRKEARSEIYQGIFKKFNRIFSVVNAFKMHNKSSGEGNMSAEYSRVPTSSSCVSVGGNLTPSTSTNNLNLQNINVTNN